MIVKKKIKKIEYSMLSRFELRISNTLQIKNVNVFSIFLNCCIRTTYSVNCTKCSTFLTKNKMHFKQVV